MHDFCLNNTIKYNVECNVTIMNSKTCIFRQYFFKVKMILADSRTKCTTISTVFQGNRDPLSQRLPNNTTRLGAGEDWKYKEGRRQLLFPGTWLMLLSWSILTIPQARRADIVLKCCAEIPRRRNCPPDLLHRPGSASQVWPTGLTRFHLLSGPQHSTHVLRSLCWRP